MYIYVRCIQCVYSQECRVPDIVQLYNSSILFMKYTYLCMQTAFKRSSNVEFWI